MNRRVSLVEEERKNKIIKKVFRMGPRKAHFVC